MQFHTIKRVHKNKKGRLVGRGGKRGKTSGRGGKGQTARAGSKMRPEMRDFIKRLPKLRGRGKNSFKSIETKPVIVNLISIEKAFSSGDKVNPETLHEKGVVSNYKGQLPNIKILGDGDLTKKLEVSKCAFSASAKAKILKAGGTVS